MKKLLILLLLPLFSFSQEDIERYKVYETTNIYTSLLLDSATGLIWQLQIGLPDTDQLKTPLNDYAYAEYVEDITKQWNESIDSKMKEWEKDYNSEPDSIVSPETKRIMKPYNLEQLLEVSDFAQNGRFKLYPTGNMYNYIMVDVIDGRTWQVQWSTKENEMLVRRFWNN